VKLRVFVSIISLTVALGVGAASSASASGPRSPAGAGSVLPLTAPPGGSCSTSFNPGAPQGAPMHQYYWNCGSSSESVCPAHIIQGAVHVDWWSIADLNPGQWVDWYWPATERNTSYTTVFCDGSAAEQGIVASPSAWPCFTTFSPGAPQGLPMTQSYRNCNSSSVAVVPAYWFRGTLHVTWAAECPDQCLNITVDPGYTVIWQWPSTVVGASYTTVFSDELGVYAQSVH
jgi:hypothetical protein